MGKIELKVKLSKDDFRRVSALAAMAGQSLSELAQDFLADLAGGKASRGSDERDLADDWYHRGYIGPETFLQYISRAYGTNGVISFLEDYQEHVSDLDYETDILTDLGRACREGNQEEIDSLKKEAEEAGKTSKESWNRLNETFQEYLDHGGIGDINNALMDCRKWYHEYERQEDQLQEEEEG